MGVYDWDAYKEGDSEVERELNRMKRLSGAGGSTYLTRGEFYAVMEMHVRDTAVFHQRIDRLEDTVYAPKRFVVAVLWSGWGRVLLIALAILAAIALAEAREHLPWDWLWTHQR